MKIQTILCPTDFSEPADHALAAAHSLAQQFDARLVVVHVIEPMQVVPAPQVGTTPAFDISHYLGAMREHGERMLVERTATLRDAGIDADWRLAEGAVADKDQRAQPGIGELGADTRRHREAHRGVVGRAEELGAFANEQIGRAEQRVRGLIDAEFIGKKTNSPIDNWARKIDEGAYRLYLANGRILTKAVAAQYNEAAASFQEYLRQKGYDTEAMEIAPGEARPYFSLTSDARAKLKVPEVKNDKGKAAKLTNVRATIRAIGAEGNARPVFEFVYDTGTVVSQAREIIDGKEKLVDVYSQPGKKYLAYKDPSILAEVQKEGTVPYQGYFDTVGGAGVPNVGSFVAGFQKKQQEPESVGTTRKE